MIDTPEEAVAYWRANIPKADWFDPAKEAGFRVFTKRDPRFCFNLEVIR